MSNITKPTIAHTYTAERNYLWILWISPERFSVMLHCFWVFLLLKEIIACTAVA
jgi:uncharacterized membrane protein